MRRTSSRTIPTSGKSLLKFSTLYSWEICSICSRVFMWFHTNIYIYIYLFMYLFIIYIYIYGQSQNQWTLVRLTFLDPHITTQLLLVVLMSLVLILIRQSQLLRSSTQLGKGLKQLKTESGRVGLKLLLIGITQRPFKSTTSHSDKRKSTTKRVLHQRCYYACWARPSSSKTPKSCNPKAISTTVTPAKSKDRCHSSYPLAI